MAGCICMYDKGFLWQFVCERSHLEKSVSVLMKFTWSFHHVTHHIAAAERSALKTEFMRVES